MSAMHIDLISVSVFLHSRIDHNQKDLAALF